METEQYLNRDHLRRIVGLVYRDSQKDAAKHFGVSEPVLSRMLTGRSTPHLGQITRIARSLGVTVDSLLVNGDG